MSGGGFDPTAAGPGRSSDQGVSAIEFALLLPLLVLFLFGIIQFGRAYNAKITLSHAAREGVRALVVGGDPVTTAEAGAGSLSVSVSADDCDDDTLGEPVSVTVSYVYSYPIPLFGDVNGTMSETATMRCEQP